MKSFSDLQFKPHANFTGLMSSIFFDNGYGVSVVRFEISPGHYGSYTSNENEWELAVLKGNKDNNHICYDTEITDDVLRHLSEDEVTEVMQKVQSL